MNGNNNIYVGYGRESISPRYPDGTIIPVRTAGYPQTRICRKIVSEIYSSCTAFKAADGNTVLLFSVEIEGFYNEYIKPAAEQVSKATGVAPENIVFSVTHSHTAPGLAYDEEEAVYWRGNIFFPALVKSAEQAVADLALCTDVYVGCADGTGYNFVRRYDEDENGNLTHEAEADHSLPLARFVREGKRDVIVANWAAHCDTMSVTNKEDFYSVGSDYVGAFRDTIERSVDAYVSIYMGGNGDVNPFSRILGEFKFPGTDPYGKAIADIVLKALPTLRRLDAKGPVKMLCAVPRLDIEHTRDHLAPIAEEICRIYNEDNKSPKVDELCKQIGIGALGGIHGIMEAGHIAHHAKLPKDEEYPLSAFRVGDIAFGVAPCEMFAKTAMDIKAASPFEQTIVLAHSNGAYSYLPADYCFDKHDYETSSCRYTRGAAEKVQREINKLIDELYKG